MEEIESSQREAILRAALDEFVNRGIDRFSVKSVARRAGVVERDITTIWGDGRVLLMETALRVARMQTPTPDTGSLRGDVEATARMVIDNAEDFEWRKRYHRLLASGRDTDFSEIRSDFWDARYEDFVDVFRRADARGELREGINYVDACRMFISAFTYDLVYHGTPIRPEYATQTVEILLRGISR